ncbi:MAG TPA: hypothetical protein VFG30_23010 [Polyangiales bacterium]|nr:hypothetical protein [Polyangiales bacterium]
MNPYATAGFATISILPRGQATLAAHRDALRAAVRAQLTGSAGEFLVAVVGTLVDSKLCGSSKSF